MIVGEEQRSGLWQDFYVDNYLLKGQLSIVLDLYSVKICGHS
jgi:hypothetical protein